MMTPTDPVAPKRMTITSIVGAAGPSVLVVPALAKPWWESKTIWINALVLVGSWVLNHQGVLEAAGLSAQTQVAVLAVVNLALRSVTNSAVTLKGQP
jgi:hypothetical protein